jgi:hypothetical protein
MDTRQTGTEGAAAESFNVAFEDRFAVSGVAPGMRR